MKYGKIDFSEMTLSDRKLDAVSVPDDPGKPTMAQNDRIETHYSLAKEQTII